MCYITCYIACYIASVAFIQCYITSKQFYNLVRNICCQVQDYVLCNILQV